MLELAPMLLQYSGAFCCVLFLYLFRCASNKHSNTHIVRVCLFAVKSLSEKLDTIQQGIASAAACSDAEAREQALNVASKCPGIFSYTCDRIRDRLLQGGKKMPDVAMSTLVISSDRNCGKWNYRSLCGRKTGRNGPAQEST